MIRLPSYTRIPGGRAFASLSRRVRTLIVAGLLFIVLFALALTLPVPYVILSPGPTYNTLGTDDAGDVIIRIQGLTTQPTTGHLNLTTVGETTGPVNAFEAIAGWLRGDEVVVPRTAVVQPGETQEQAQRQNTQDFLQSQDSATAAALCEMHYPKGFGIQSVISHGPSDGVLKPGDEFVAVGGRPANTPAKLQAVLAAERPGRTVPVVVNRQTSPTSRNAVPTTVDVTLGKPSGNRKGALLGVRVVSGCLAPFTVDLGLGNQIGGPSAGMMFALGIIDKVGLLGNLTGGRFVAGTGTIDPNGKVGPIGGISLKMIAARRKGATVFLAPAANCADVRKDTPGGLQVIKVATLHQAVDDLHALQSGKSVPGC